MSLKLCENKIHNSCHASFQPVMAIGKYKVCLISIGGVTLYVSHNAMYYWKKRTFYGIHPTVHAVEIGIAIFTNQERTSFIKFQAFFINEFLYCHSDDNLFLSSK